MCRSGHESRPVERVACRAVLLSQLPNNTHSLDISCRVKLYSPIHSLLTVNTRLPSPFLVLLGLPSTFLLSFVNISQAAPSFQISDFPLRFPIRLCSHRNSFPLPISLSTVPRLRPFHPHKTTSHKRKKSAFAESIERLCPFLPYSATIRYDSIDCLLLTRQS